MDFGPSRHIKHPVWLSIACYGVVGLLSGKFCAVCKLHVQMIEKDGNAESDVYLSEGLAQTDALASEERLESEGVSRLSIWAQ